MLDQSRMAAPFRAGRAIVVALLVSACGTVDPGDNFVPPDLTLDDDFFFCRIQPEVLTPHTCASGMPGEGGMCHSSKSALRLSELAESESVACDGDTAVGPVPASFESNLDAVRITVQADALSSPLYRRPLMLDSHPREIFAADSAEAMLIIEWISRGTM